ncbi:MAG: type IV secretory system conjugative DNA transfer family protein [Lachnospiraceae bacterium]
MTKKEKRIIASIIIGIGTIFNIFFTAMVHSLLAREVDSLTLISLWDCLVGIVTVSQHRMLFLTFEGFLILCCIVFFIENNRPYQSDLIKVTENIYTPAPVGQHQHGSSRWLKAEEKDKVFSPIVIDTKNKVIKELIDTGYDNLDFMKKSKKKDETRQDVPKDTEDILPISINNQKKEDKDENFETVDFDIKATNLKKVVTVKKEEPPKKDRYKLFEKGGIVVGMEKDGDTEKLHCVNTDTHTLTIGATRSGKTRCLVIQSICTLGLAGESLVISDPKAELFQYTSEFLQKIGYEIICLDFKNPNKSTRYNLLQPVIDAVNQNDLDKAEMYAWDITNILVGDNTSNEKIWENGEKSTIAGAILCVVYDNRKRPEYQNLTNVYWFIAEMGKSVGNKTPMQDYMAIMPNDHPARALLSIAAVAPSRTKGSFDTSSLTTLRLFTSRSMYSITHKSDYNIAEIGEKKQALFLILPDEKTTYYPIASLMVSQLYELLVRKSDERGGRLVNRVNFVLDEFGNFAKLTDFSNKLTVAGGRGIRFNLFLQSFEQLTDKYSKELSAIVKANCQTWAYLQADDDETLESVCKKLGKYTTSAYQLSAQHGKYVNPSSSHSISLVGRELLTTDEIRRISRPYQIIVGRSHPALMNAPDLSKWYFNKMCGLGDEEHNRKVRAEREAKRPILSSDKKEIQLWGVWTYHSKSIELSEQRKQSNALKAQMGATFSSKTFDPKSYGGNKFNEKN